MSMHTSQHLLSALLETRLNLPTLSWSLTTYPAPCYVEVPRGMSLDEVTAIQTEANKLVFEGRKVHIEVDELDRDQGKDVPTHVSGRVVGRGLPEDYTGGVKRVVLWYPSSEHPQPSDVSATSYRRPFSLKHHFRQALFHLWPPPHCPSDINAQSSV
jgi:hypothetical protein